jgi:hypothetical protein
MQTTVATRSQSPSRPPSRLGAIRRGTLNHALRHLLYGTEGIGKSTLAKHAPNPVWFDCEDGTAQLDVARYQFRDDALGHVPNTLEEVYSAIEDLRVGEHDFRTLVIDTVDSLEALVFDQVCETESGKKSGINKSGKKISGIEDFGFAKGYIVALDEWRLLCSRLDRLRVERKVSIILLGHSTIRTYKNPLGDDYDRINLRLHEKAAGFLKEWSDVVGYCAYEDGADKKDDDSRARGFSTGRRLIHLQRSAAWDAKTRIHLPAEIEIATENPWAPFAAALEVGQSTTPADLVKLIDAELVRIGDEETKVKATEAIAGVTDTATLSRYLNALKERPAKEQTS